jgi:hypothetical protein
MIEHIKESVNKERTQKIQIYAAWVVVLGERAVEGRANRLSNYGRVAGAERRPPVAFGKLMRQSRERPRHRHGRRWFVR